MTQPDCTKMAISQLSLGVASSNLVGRKSKCYFVIKFSLLLSIRLCWREIRPDTDKTTENEFSSEMTIQRSGFDKTLVLLMNRHACLVALSLTNTLF